MAIAMKGLKAKPTYESLIGVAFSDGFGKLNSLSEMLNSCMMDLF